MTVYLIRHGQSEFNAAYTGEGDPMIRDAPLTEKGRAQALELRDHVQTLNISHLICSPLTRAIQTSRLGFPALLPEVWELAQEHQEHSCDVGRSPKTLADAFPELDFSKLPESWGFQGLKNSFGVAVEPRDVFKARMIKLREALTELTQDRIAVVCHGYVIEELTGVDPDNCQIVELKR